MPESGQLLTTESLLDELDRTMTGQNRKIEELLREIQETENALEQNNRMIGAVQTRKNMQEELDRTAKEITLLEPEMKLLQGELAGLRKQQEQIDMLKMQLHSEEEKLPAYEEADRIREELDRADKALKKERQLQEEKTEALKRMRKDYDCATGRIEELRDAELRVIELKQQTELNKRQTDIWKKLIVMCEESKRLQNDMDNKQERYRTVSMEHQEKKQQYEKMQQRYLDEQAGILSEQLTDGEPCPVCGSLTHPLPANRHEDAPDKAAVDQAKAMWEKTSFAMQEMSRAAGIAKGALEKVQQEFRERLKTEGIKGEEGQVEEQLIHKLAQENSLSDELRIKLEDAEKWKKEKTKLTEQKNKLETYIQSAEHECRETEEKIAELKVQTELLGNKLKDRQKMLPYETKAQAAEQIAYKRSVIEQHESTVKQTESACREKENTYQNALQKRETLSGQLTQNEQHQSLEELLEKKDALMSYRDARQNMHREIAHRYETNKKLSTFIRRQSSELMETEKRWSMVKELSNTINGSLSGKDKIMLETYVQMQYFDRIIRRANTRFMVMSAGQYELKRSVQAENLKKQSGLELDVTDHYNGTERSVKTLSGGEAFLASLSLALGLSDEIQAVSGGIALDTMFVDEGFGSLDEAALNQAIHALMSLTEGNRLVGIISHVSELQERIDRKLVVTKDAASGSSVSLVME